MSNDTAAQIDAILKVVQGKRHLVHGVFSYYCAECSTVELVGLGYGVEGPKALRDAGTYIPSPFMMSCPVCRGGSSHFCFQSDNFFTPREVGLPMRVFRVPEFGPEPEHYNSSMFAGELVGTPFIVFRR